MSTNKKEKVIHVDKLIIHAKDVEIIQKGDLKNLEVDDLPKGNPWDFFWGRPRPQKPLEKEYSSEDIQSENEQ